MFETIDHATKCIQKECNKSEDYRKNIEALDKYDFSEFLTDGRSLWNLRDAIEEKYDQEFWKNYGFYVWDCLDGDDTCKYFASRYKVWFQEYTDWVVRHENNKHEEAERRK